MPRRTHMTTDDVAKHVMDHLRARFGGGADEVPATEVVPSLGWEVGDSALRVCYAARRGEVADPLIADLMTTMGTLIENRAEEIRCGDLTENHGSFAEALGLPAPGTGMSP